MIWTLFFLTVTPPIEIFPWAQFMTQQDCQVKAESVNSADYDIFALCKEDTWDSELVIEI